MKFLLILTLSSLSAVVQAHSICEQLNLGDQACSFVVKVEKNLQKLEHGNLNELKVNKLIDMCDNTPKSVGFETENEQFNYKVNEPEFSKVVDYIDSVSDESGVYYTELRD